MTTWVFLRGLSREARHWGDFPAIFRAAFDRVPGTPEARPDILTPDLPGNGRRCAEPSPTRVEAMMEDCRRQLREAGRAPPYHLLALSLGGMVAVAWAARYPEECRALVLLSTSMRPHNPVLQRLRPSAWPTVLGLLVAGPAARERAILELTSARAGELREVLPYWTAWARACPVSRRNTLRQLLAAARFTQVDKPDVPLLLLAGSDDRMVDPRCSRQLARNWGGTLRMHPFAGHDLTLDDGEWVARAVLAWLDGMVP